MIQNVPDELLTTLKSSDGIAGNGPGGSSTPPLSRRSSFPRSRAHVPVPLFSDFPPIIFGDLDTMPMDRVPSFSNCSDSVNTRMSTVTDTRIIKRVQWLWITAYSLACCRLFGLTFRRPATARTFSKSSISMKMVCFVTGLSVLVVLYSSLCVSRMISQYWMRSFLLGN